MATKAREAVGKNKLEVSADRGCFKGPGMLACEEAGIKTYVPEPMMFNSRAEGRFIKRVIGILGIARTLKAISLAAGCSLRDQPQTTRRST